jgi:hypothetical protein
MFKSWSTGTFLRQASFVLKDFIILHRPYIPAPLEASRPGTFESLARPEIFLMTCNRRPSVLGDLYQRGSLLCPDHSCPRQSWYRTQSEYVGKSIKSFAAVPMNLQYNRRSRRHLLLPSFFCSTHGAGSALVSHTIQPKRWRTSTNV